MAKKGGGKRKGGRDDMLGPLYSKPDGYELGSHKVEGPHGGLTTPDPVGFGHGVLRTGPGGTQMKQKHEKD